MESERTPQTRATPTETDESKILTIEGQGTTTSFEITVDGRIEMDVPDPLAEATVVSGASAQGAIDTGVQRFRVYGEVSDVTFLNRAGAEAGPVVDPECYVE